MFTNRDLGILMESGTLDDLDDRSVLDAIVAGSTNIVNEKGEPMEVAPEVKQLFRDQLINHWLNNAIRKTTAEVDVFAKRAEKARKDLQFRAYTAVGIPAREVEIAEMRKDAGDPSDLLRVYSRYIERC